MTKKLLIAGVAALTVSGTTVAPTSADAQVYFGRGGHWGGSPYYGRAWGGRGYWGGYRPAGYWGGYRPYGYWGGYRPVGYYPRYGYGYGYPYYYRRRSNAGAVAAGLVGGLALGAIAANAARPAYYYPSTTVAASCWFERRRAFDRFGRRVITRVQVCA